MEALSNVPMELLGCVKTKIAVVTIAVQRQTAMIKVENGHAQLGRLGNLAHLVRQVIKETWAHRARKDLTDPKAQEGNEALLVKRGLKVHHLVIPFRQLQQHGHCLVPQSS
jgi:hypothetical protein